MRKRTSEFDVIVVGAGHAGIEAASAVSRLKCSVLLITMSIDNIGKISCNPAVGGVAKSHLVREVDIFGGAIARLADLSATQYRVLNQSKGKAVWALRVQIDRHLYNRQAKDLILSLPNLRVFETEVEEILTLRNRVYGVLTQAGEFFSSRVILCPGTFLDGLVHIGFRHFPQGRLGEPASQGLFRSLKKHGFLLKHFKTGTCPRIDFRTLDFSRMNEQKPDYQAGPFSIYTDGIPNNQLSCFITATNQKTHALVKRNLRYSPLYQGIIKGTSVRYCPSLEDKVVKFDARKSHHVFIEPEGFSTFEAYPNGISNSLPFDVQCELVHSIPGMEKATILKPGYGIEHAVIDARVLYPTLEAKKIRGLFFAGQINGTTGYEEAAAQGLVAGVNAALQIHKKPPFILGRRESFIGLLIDELIEKGTNEPYRMFTSRSELRMTLRESNADRRLYRMSFQYGLIDEKIFHRIAEKEKRIQESIRQLKTIKIHPTPDVNQKLLQLNTSSIHQTICLGDLLKRPQIVFSHLSHFSYISKLTPREEDEVEIEIKYEGFLKRELHQLAELKDLDRVKLPYIPQVSGLSREIIEKLKTFQPRTIGQALQIPGFTVAAALILLNYFRSKKHSKQSLEK